MTVKGKILTIILLATLMLPMAAGIAYADKTKLTIPKPVTLPGLTSVEQKEESAAKKYVGEIVMPYMANIMIGAAVMLCFLFLVIGGIKYMTAYGNEETIGSAKNTIIFSIVGLLIALFSYAIVALIAGLKLDKEVQQTTWVETAYAKYDEKGEPKINQMGNIGVEDKNTPYLKDLPFARVPEGQDETGYITQTLYSNLIKLALGIASVLIVISFVIAGTFYVTAQGNEDQLNKAKSILIYTLIAVAIIASAYGITMGVTKIKNQVWQGTSATESTTGP